MAVLGFEPIATQIAKLVSASQLLPPGVLEEVRAGCDSGADPAMSLETRDFFCHYMVLVRAANALLDAPQFARLLRLHEEIQETYMPGGPPMSPLYDSYAIQHVLAEVPHGPGDETPYSVLARLTAGRSPKPLHELALQLSRAHLDLYRVVRADGLQSELENVRNGEALSVQLTGPFLRTGDRILARVLVFQGKSFVADSPYLLQAPEREWLDYFARVVEQRREQDADRRAAMSAKTREAQPARSLAPDEVIRRHLKHGPSERFWLDYVMDGYAGERRGIVLLAGVPDRPELLPHSEHYVPVRGAAAAGAVPPAVRLRTKLLEAAEREGLLKVAEQDLARACDALGVPASGAEEWERPLLVAYATLGVRGSRGLTALEQFVMDAASDARGKASVDIAELRETIASLQRGWFAVVRVERIHLDAGLDVSEVLRRKKLHVRERSATRQLDVGDLVLGWICQDDHGVLTFEGGVARVPEFLAPSFVKLAKEICDAHKRASGAREYRKRASQLPPLMMATVRAVISGSPGATEPG